jgi:hypothetical protein
MKNAVFGDVTPCGSCKNRVLKECIASIVMVKRIDELGIALAVTSEEILFLHSVLQVLGTANVVLSSTILVTLNLEKISSSETSALTRAMRRHIPEEGILHSHLCENLKAYMRVVFYFCLKY